MHNERETLEAEIARAASGQLSRFTSSLSARG